MDDSEIQDLYEKYLEKLQEIVYGNLVPKIALFSFFANQLAEDREAATRSAPLLFFMVEALELDLILTCAKLLEGKRSDRNVDRFLNYVEANRTRIRWANGEISHALVQAQKDAIQEQRPIIDKIFVQRDKYFAHADKKYFFDPEKLHADFPVSTDELIQLLRTLQDILSEHYYGLASRGKISVEGFVHASAHRMYEKLMAASDPEPEGKSKRTRRTRRP